MIETWFLVAILLSLSTALAPRQPDNIATVHGPTTNSLAIPAITARAIIPLPKIDPVPDPVPEPDPYAPKPDDDPDDLSPDYVTPKETVTAA